MTRRLNTPYGEIVYEYTPKRVRNLNLRLRADGSIRVSAPRGTPMTQIEAFLLQHAARVIAWQKKQEDVKSKPVLLPKETSLQEGVLLYFQGNPYRLHLEVGKRSLSFSETGTATLSLADPHDPKKCLEAWKVEIKHFLQPFLEQRCQSYLPWFLARGAKEPTELRLRSMHRAYGNCRPQSSVLTFSLMLAAFPPHLCDYIVCHELTHLLIPDHSARFYATLAQVCPNHRQCKEEIKRFGEK